MNNEHPEVTGYEALYRSMMKCKKGVMWKDSTAHFCLNGLTEVMKLEQSLIDGTYKERPGRTFTVYEPKKREILSISFRDRIYQRSLTEVMKLEQSLIDGTYKERPGRTFTVYEPKKREILSISFRDRIYQRSLNDNAVYPMMAKSFIYDNCACQQGKGTDFAMNRLNAHLQRYYRKHGKDGWVLQCDIKGYYPNMPHEVAEKKFAKHLDEWTFAEVKKILDRFEGDIGFNPGSQLIQIAGISVLDEMDHFVKEKLRVRHYLRYMDDFLLISDDKEFLRNCLENIKEYLKERGFEDHFVKEKLRVRHYLRYMDDFLLISDDKEFLRNCLENIKEYLKERGFELNEKTSLYRISQGIKFLGFRFRKYKRIFERKGVRVK